MPAPVVLEGSLVRLEPLTLDAVDGLTAAAAESRDSYAFTLVPASRDEMVDYVAAALAEQQEGRSLPFALRVQGRVVGTTRFLDLDYWDGAVGSVPDVAEIGSTWLAASVQRTAVNTEAKLLLLGHAFDRWRVHRVSFKTDGRNERSRRAIERLGAHYEGIRRAHVVASDGTIRNSAYYSILRDEWPAVRQRLEARLSRDRTSPRAGRR